MYSTEHSTVSKLAAKGRDWVLKLDAFVEYRQVLGTVELAWKVKL